MIMWCNSKVTNFLKHKEWYEQRNDGEFIATDKMPSEEREALDYLNKKRLEEIERNRIEIED